LSSCEIFASPGDPGKSNAHQLGRPPPSTGLVPIIRAARLPPLLKAITQRPVLSAAKPQANDADGRDKPGRDEVRRSVADFTDLSADLGFRLSRA
jgi:hypothetical protein